MATKTRPMLVWKTPETLLTVPNYDFFAFTDFKSSNFSPSWTFQIYLLGLHWTCWWTWQQKDRCRQHWKHVKIKISSYVIPQLCRRSDAKPSISATGKLERCSFNNLTFHMFTFHWERWEHVVQKTFPWTSHRPQCSLPAHILFDKTVTSMSEKNL